MQVRLLPTNLWLKFYLLSGSGLWLCSLHGSPGPDRRSAELGGGHMEGLAMDMNDIGAWCLCVLGLGLVVFAIVWGM